MGIELIIALLTYFISRANGASNAEALGAAAIAGAGTYYVKNNTSWGQEYLGTLDGSYKVATDSSGNVIRDADGDEMYVPVGATNVQNGANGLTYDMDGTTKSNSLGDVTKVATVAGGVVAGSAAAGTIAENWPALLIGGTALWFIFFRRKEEKVIVQKGDKND